MARRLVRSRTLVTHVTGRHSWNEVKDGALLVEDGRIAAVGPFKELSEKHPGIEVVGTGNEVVLPGFVNAHHHIGLTPLQLGCVDLPLELMFITRLATRPVDLYLDTLYSAFEMIASGVTTVQHIQVGRGFGALPDAVGRIDQIMRAYDDIGMRVSYAFGIRDQNQFTYKDDDEFVAGLPADLRAPTAALLANMRSPLSDNIGLFEDVLARHKGKDRVRVQLAPANLHWLGDEALRRLSDLSAKHDLPMHMHLLETPYQKEYARRRSGLSAVEHIDRFGLLGPRMTLGHGVWVTERDIERLAETGTCVCSNCSSNFRLSSGMAPLNRFEAAGVPLALGIDEAGINDDRDMLQEMRLMLYAHREPGMHDRAPTTAQVLRMATEGGAKTTGFADSIGRLEVGRAADMVLLDWDQIAEPYLDPEAPLLDAVIQRAKSQGVRAVLCAGEVIYQHGKFTRVDQAQALAELRALMARPRNQMEQDRLALATALLPHARAFYDTYLDGADHRPFYKGSSLV